MTKFVGRTIDRSFGYVYMHIRHTRSTRVRLTRLMVAILTRDAPDGGCVIVGEPCAIVSRPPVL
jgi:hypothetical protein